MWGTQGLLPLLPTHRGMHIHSRAPNTRPRPPPRWCTPQVEEDKEAVIRDLETQILSAGMHIEQSSAATSSLQEQLSNCASRDEQIANALHNAVKQTQHLEVLCARTERMSEKQVCPSACCVSRLEAAVLEKRGLRFGC
jgi:hypothetical protein